MGTVKQYFSLQMTVRVLLPSSFMHSTQGKNSADISLKYFSYFSQKSGFSIHANPQFAWNIYPVFWEKLENVSTHIFSAKNINVFAIFQDINFNIT